MKPGLIITALSCSGLALLTGIVLLARTELPAPTAIDASSSPPVSSPIVTDSTSRVVSAAARSTPGPVTSFRWSSLESTDYKQYIANLRGLGCPEGTIREIIVADINKLYAPREAPFKTKLAAQSAIESLSITARRAARQVEFEQRRQLHEIQKEKNGLLQQLLGITLPLEPLRAVGVHNYALFEAAFNALPSNKRESVRQIQENYWLATDAVGDIYNEKRRGDYRAEYKRLNQERNAQLTRLLTPEELDEFEMRTANVAVALREPLATFNPTEQEYRAIWSARKQSDEPTSSSERAQQAETQIKAALGEQRFAEYERSQDPTYRSLIQLTERYGLPPETALKGYNLQKAYQERQQKLRDDSSLTPEQRQENLASLRADTLRSLTETLGEKATRAFQQYGAPDAYADDGQE